METMEVSKDESRRGNQTKFVCMFRSMSLFVIKRERTGMFIKMGIPVFLTVTGPSITLISFISLLMWSVMMIIIC